jgi:starch synthase
MRIAMVASECEPFAKTGGLADVVDALSRELGRQGHDVDVYLPLYRGVRPPDGSARSIVRLTAELAGGTDSTARASAFPAQVQLVTGQADGYRIRLVDHPPSFDRAAFYGEGADYPDNGRRFTLLGRVALQAIRDDDRPTDVVHGHDWQSGPALMLARAASGPATLLSCHNLAYHGWVPRKEAALLGLPGTDPSGDGIDLLRGAILAADIVNTVSPTYARETLSPEYGAGLHDVLRSVGDRYFGILNGIDTALWDPETDATIAARYSAGDLAGKAICKADLLARHRLDTGADRGDRGAPLFGMVGRLDPQKGFDLLAGAAERLLELDARIVVLGTGDHALIRDLQAVAARHRDRLAVMDRFDRDEARRIYAGADVFLMPSRFEPCGQGQMISFRYGTLPLVRSTGGLADTVFDADRDRERGNGFVFGPATSAALGDAAERAIAAYRDPARWSALVQRAMAEDFAWSRPAKEYVAAYERARTPAARTSASGGSARAVR